ncbi:putative High choriolytic enzyme 1 [Hypsibius exemplaris]|uniref:Metalloendopeptidase n=1 Tax=Hypsibius exemplaris TaxID=2072580 RepID=A0A9X6RLL6_HYPEX|nr:putative High choriolytic enzyme 1 [Hypsibius exemplaris]
MSYVNRPHYRSGSAIVWVFRLVTICIHLPGLNTGHSLSKREEAFRVPRDWRNLIDADVYDYSKKKKDSSIDADRIEGDILGDYDPTMGVASNLGKNAINDNQLWSNGTVPYTIKIEEFSSTDISLIENAIREMMANTCLKFLPRANEKSYITFTRATDGCYTSVGQISGQQRIYLHSSCLTLIGEIQHEIMHVLGFQHEQSREDRDKYVHVIFDNIPSALHNQFAKYKGRTFGLPYDYNSIMHFAHNTFSIDPDNKPSILPIQQAPIGNRKKLSVHDIERINALYKCPKQEADDSHHGGPVTKRLHTPSSASTTDDFPQITTNTREIQSTSTQSPVEMGVESESVTESSPPQMQKGKSSLNKKARCPANANGLAISSCNSNGECESWGEGTLCCTFCHGGVCNNYCAG